MKKYTVVLKHPEYVNDNVEIDAFPIWHVEASTPQDAAKNAKQEMCDSCDAESPNDWFVIAVFDGHLIDLQQGEGK